MVVSSVHEYSTGDILDCEKADLVRIMYMKIMYLIFSFNVGGIERLLVDQCNGMASRGHRVTLCVINEDVTESILNEISHDVEVLMLHRPAGGGQLPYMGALAKEVQRRQIEVLHCEGMNCVLFSILAKVRNPQLVVLNTVHDVGNYSSYSSAKIWFSNRILDETVAISDSVKSEILERKMNPDKVTTICNAIDTEKFHYVDRSGRGILKDREIHLVHIARFFPKKKGQDTLLQALEMLLERYPKLHCTFAGAPAKGQEELYRQMQQDAENKGLSSNVIFAGSVDDVFTLLAGADLFVLPSNYEGFGISLIEAMATGLPCVASDLEGPAEIMRRAESEDVNAGQLVPAGDAKALADALEDMIQNYEQYDGRKISAYTASVYGMDAFLDQNETLYRRLINHRRQ